VTLIIDAAPLVALGDRRDPLHQAVLQTLESEAGELVVPAPVSAEIDYLLRSRGGRDAARRFLRDVAEGRLQVEGLDREEHGIVLDLDNRYADLDVGLADLSVVVLAQRFRTRRLLTFDERHFRTLRPVAGGAFTLLPADRDAPAQGTRPRRHT
jgi:predicted nucleic acid-binding protein